MKMPIAESNERPHPLIDTPSIQRPRDFNSRFEAAAIDLPDIDEVIERNRTRVLPQCIIGYMFASEMGPYIAYHLAIYPAYAEFLIGLSPRDALLAIDSYAEMLATIYGSNAIRDPDLYQAQ